MDASTMDKGSRTHYKSPAWPNILLATLTLLGVFKGRPLEALRSCMLCRRKRMDVRDTVDDDTNTESDMETDENDNRMKANETAEESRLDRNCAVCSSLLWNADGEMVHDYTKAVPRWLNSFICGILSNTLIALFMGCSVFTLGWYVVNYWGRIQQVTHLVSFMAFGVIIVGVALICTVSNAMQCFYRGPMKGGAWYEVLHQDYIARRLRCLAGRRFPLPAVMFLVFSMVWVFANNVMQVMILIQSLHANSTSSINTTSKSIPSAEMDPVRSGTFVFLNTTMVVVVAIIGLPIYAFFWYYVLVMRTALTAEFNLVLVFIRRYKGNLDWCRRRVVEIYRDFRLLNNILAGLMPFIMASSVLGITVHISWNYSVYSDPKKHLAKENLLINIFIFSLKFMVLIIPLLAVGGLNIEYIWLQFEYALSRQRSSDHEEFWDHVLNFTRELRTEQRGHHLTLFLSVISLYLGGNLKDQNLDYRNNGLL